MVPIHQSPRHKRDTSSETGKKRIPSEQWEAKRGIITQLYHEENKSLKEVMDILERDYGFSATYVPLHFGPYYSIDWSAKVADKNSGSVKMFKTRVKAWGIDKKLKNPEVFAIMVLKRDRDAIGKASEFTIRGHPVDMDNINRYIRRNPELITRLHAGDRPTTQALAEVQCRTPDLRLLPQLLPSAIGATHQSLPAQREVLVLLKEYVEQSFDSGRWTWEYDVSCTTSNFDACSEELFERTLTSLAVISRCMSSNDAARNSVMLDPAFSSPTETMLEPALAALRELVAAQSPVFAARMMSILWFLDTHHDGGLLQLIVPQLSAIVAKMLGPYHVMARSWQILASDTQHDYRDFCESAYAMLVPLFEQRLGTANLITVMLYGDHVDYLSHNSRLDEALALCQQYQAKAESTRRQHPWIAQLAWQRRAIVETQEDISGTIAAIDLELASGHSSSSNNNNNNNSSNDSIPRVQEPERRAALLLRQGNLAMHAGQPSAASIQYAQAVQGLEEAGGDDRLLLASLANLEAAQKGMGDCEGAEGTRARRMRVQGGFAMETNGLAGEQRRARGSLSSSGDDSWSRRRSSGMMEFDVSGGADAGAGAGSGSGTAAMARPAGLPGSEAGWGWSPGVFANPNSATIGLADWSCPM
ncbi:clr5 domain-containing protein [Sarocladium implicatum]|nr:clr5 domain-containing protein [Sarocladium implicatum]